MRTALLCFALAVSSSCTVVNSVALPSVPGGPNQAGEVFITAGDITQPHEVLGLVQVHRAGVLLFGLVDIIGTDLEAGFRETLMPEVKRLGGDGVVRVRYHMTQYTPWAKALGVIFFIFPLPSQVTITGQVVKLKAG
ncbi:MAG: hypothetical protein Q8L14_03885 [Myxococcales bacterium]|nr:hypothetical protein [Myxococcales bacterium]